MADAIMHMLCTLLCHRYCLFFYISTILFVLRTRDIIILTAVLKYSSYTDLAIAYSLMFKSWHQLKSSQQSKAFKNYTTFVEFRLYPTLVPVSRHSDRS